jgi:hypothetical protein
MYLRFWTIVQTARKDLIECGKDAFGVQQNNELLFQTKME